MDEAKKIQPARNRGGEWVQVGDEVYRIPPLAFRHVQELQEEVTGLAVMGTRPTADQMKTVTKIVHSAMQRNYPELTVDQVDDMLDLGNYQQVLGAVLAIGGFVEKKGGAEPGEAQAGAPSTAP